MTRLTQLCTTTTLATLLTTSAVMADVTAQQVWDDWRALMSSTGAQVGFEQSASDGILAINNLNLTTNPRRGEPSNINLGSLVFQEQNNGSVLVLLPSDAPIVITKDDTKATLNQSHKDLSLVVSGTPKDLTYTYKADALTLTLAELLVAGEKVTDASATVTLNDLNGTTQTRNADLLEAIQDVTIGSLSYQLDIIDTVKETKVSSQGSITDWQNTLNIAIPANMDNATFQQALQAGLRANWRISYKAIAASVKLSEKGEVTNISGTSENGAIDAKFDRRTDGLFEMSQSIAFGLSTFHADAKGTDKVLLLDFALNQIEVGFLANFDEGINIDDADPNSFMEAINSGLAISLNAIYDGLTGDFSATKDGESYAGNIASATAGFGVFFDRDNIRYTGGMGNTNASLTTPELPVGPLEFAVSEIRSKVQIPMNVSKTPAPFSYSDRIIDLSISDNLWAIFDPDKLLPRGAATYILDLEGMGNWLIDPYSEAFQNDTTDDTKGALHSLTLNELKLSVAGADLTGAGAFTFNNDDLETFDGMPAPIGALDLKIVGVNALMDTLIKIGLLQDDQAFGARMGLGLITVAGDGDDTLVSRIETTQDGHVLANGKRLK